MSKLRHLLGLFGGTAARLARWRSVPQLSCLAYHDVPAKTRDRFRAQLRSVGKHFEFIDLDEFGRRLNGQSDSKSPGMLVTFDDAFVSNHRVALDVLDEFGIRAVFFVPIGFIDCATPKAVDDYICRCLYGGRYAREQLPAELAPMNWEQLKEVVARGHFIGAHTVTHPDYSQPVPEERLKPEIVDAGDRLAERLNCSVDAFAFPFGTVRHVAPAALAVAQKRYRHVFTSVRGNNGNLGRKPIRRQSVDPSQAPGYVLFQTAGALDWRYGEARGRLDELAAAAGMEDEPVVDN